MLLEFIVSLALGVLCEDEDHSSLSSSDERWWKSLNWNKDGDGVMIFSALHKKKPLTIFDTTLKKTNLPAMLSNLSKEMLENQIFDIKYESFQNRVWLELKKESLVKTGGINAVFHGTRTNIPPFTHLKKIRGSTKFQFLLGGKCLTVGEEITYKGVKAIMLEFRQCGSERKDQTFTIIPSLGIIMKLVPEARTHLVKEKAITTFKRVKKIMNAVDIGKLE